MVLSSEHSFKSEHVSKQCSDEDHRTCKSSALETSQSTVNNRRIAYTSDQSNAKLVTSTTETEEEDKGDQHEDFKHVEIRSPEHIPNKQEDIHILKSVESEDEVQTGVKRKSSIPIIPKKDVSSSSTEKSYINSPSSITSQPNTANKAGNSFQTKESGSTNKTGSSNLIQPSGTTNKGGNSNPTSNQSGPKSTQPKGKTTNQGVSSVNQGIKPGSYNGGKSHQSKGGYPHLNNQKVVRYSDTKLDSSFCDGTLNAEGHRLERRDRNLHCGGIAAYIQGDLPAKKKKVWKSKPKLVKTPLKGPIRLNCWKALTALSLFYLMTMTNAFPVEIDCSRQIELDHKTRTLHAWWPSPNITSIGVSRCGESDLYSCHKTTGSDWQSSSSSMQCKVKENRIILYMDAIDENLCWFLKVVYLPYGDVQSCTRTFKPPAPADTAATIKPGFTIIIISGIVAYVMMKICG